ncbi:MAG: hypothetical protein QM709_08075 [Spongiibacteraceae bacterium]
MARTSDEIYAALDLGSNSFHLLLARFDGRRLMIVDRYKDMVRLAAGLQDDGNLSDEVMRRALDALSKMAERITAAAEELCAGGWYEHAACREESRYFSRQSRKNFGRAD